jgi:hypothetical protein
MSLTYRAPETYYRDVFTYRGAGGPGPIPETGNQLLSLQGVLNKLAGTSGLGEDAAANANWPGTTYGKNTVYQALIGALNEKNATSGLGLNAVCNSLAHTHGYSAVLALNVLAGVIAG